MKKCRVLNIDILDINKEILLEQLNRGVLFTPNVDHLVKLQKDKEFYKAYQKADFVVCDSVVLKLFSFILRKNRIGNIVPGSSFFPSFYNYHKENSHIKIFLLGAADGVALEAKKRINQSVGRDIVVGAHSPSFGFEKDVLECNQIIEMVNNSLATVLVVGLGAPKQEKWIMKYKEQFDKIDIFLALGATIDFEAGNVKRAPMIFRRFALEWLYRICQEPKRLWKRYFVEDMSFFSLIIKQFIGIYKNPFDKNY